MVGQPEQTRKDEFDLNARLAIRLNQDVALTGSHAVCYPIHTYAIFDVDKEWISDRKFNKGSPWTISGRSRTNC